MSFPVQSALKVDCGKIPCLQPPVLLHILHGCKHLPDLLKPGIDIGIGNIELLFLQFHVQISGGIDPGFHFHCGRKGKVLFLLNAFLLNLGLCDGLDVMLLEGVPVELVHQVCGDLCLDMILIVEFQNIPRYLTLSEPFDACRFCDGPIGVLQFPLYIQPGNIK